MKKLLRYENGDEYIVGGIVSIEPVGVDPIEDVDLSDLTDAEFEKLRKNKKDKKILNKLRRNK